MDPAGSDALAISEEGQLPHPYAGLFHGANPPPIQTGSDVTTLPVETIGNEATITFVVRRRENAPERQSGQMESRFNLNFEEG